MRFFAHEYFHHFVVNIESVREILLFLPKRSIQEKGSPIVWPSATWKWTDLGGHAAIRSKLRAALRTLWLRNPCSAIKASLYIHVQAFVAPIPPLTPVRRPTEIDPFPAHKEGDLKPQSLKIRVFSFFPPPLSSPQKNGVQIGVKQQGCCFRSTRAWSTCGATSIWALFF